MMCERTNAFASVVVRSFVRSHIRVTQIDQWEVRRAVENARALPTVNRVDHAYHPPKDLLLPTLFQYSRCAQDLLPAPARVLRGILVTDAGSRRTNCRVPGKFCLRTTVCSSGRRKY